MSKHVSMEDEQNPSLTAADVFEAEEEYERELMSGDHYPEFSIYDHSQAADRGLLSARGVYVDPTDWDAEDG